MIYGVILAVLEMKLLTLKFSREAHDAVAALRAVGHKSAYVFVETVVVPYLHWKWQEGSLKQLGLCLFMSPCCTVLPDSKKWQSFFANVLSIYFCLYKKANLYQTL